MIDISDTSLYYHLVSNLDLHNLDISAEEYSLYKAVLKEPIANVSSYAKNLGIKRSTLYSLLDALVDKGLLSKSGKDIRYRAESPEKLLDFAEAAKKRTFDQIKALEKEVPLLVSLARAVKEDAEVIVLRGPEARKQLGVILDGCTGCLFGFTYDYHVDVYLDFDEHGELVENHYLSSVMRAGDKFVFVGNDEAIGQTQNVLRRYPYLEGKWQPRWVESELFDINVNITVVDDMTAFTHFGHENKEYFACIIKDDKLAAAMKSISLFVWNHAHPIH